MSNLQEVNRQLSNFTAIRAQARTEVDTEAGKLREQARSLSEQAQALVTAFETEWAEKKEKLKAERDYLAKLELAGGKPVQTLLRELNSNNRSHFYALRAEVAAGDYTPANESVLTEETKELDENAAWQYHDHSGVHRYLLSADRTLVKMWGAPGTGHEEEFIITDREGVLKGGSLELYQTQAKTNIKKRADMLEELLTGTYTKRVNVAELNQWTK